MKVLMHTTAASPDMVLHAGQTYQLPRAVAKHLLAPGPHGQPYATEVNDRSARAHVPPPKPDPEDKDAPVDDDEFEALEDEGPEDDVEE